MEQNGQHKSVDPGGAGSTAGEPGGSLWQQPRKPFLADRLVVIMAGVAPDLTPQGAARAFRHAATIVDPEVPAHDMDPVLAFLETVSEAYHDLDRGFSNAGGSAAERASLAARTMDDLAAALDRIEDELTPYIVDLARRQAAATSAAAIAEAVAGMEPDTSIYDGRAVA